MNHFDNAPDPEDVHFYKEFNERSSNIQKEISSVLLADPDMKSVLEKQLRGSENDMEIVMNNAVQGFLAAMPLASMNRTNLYTKALAIHSNITGNTTMHDVFDEVNRQIYDEM